jgi:hypothetical protein
MPRQPIALFAAEGVALDQLTGRLTAFNILDNIFAAGLPAMLPRLHVVGVYELEPRPETVFTKVQLLDPSGAVLSELVVKVEFAARAPGKAPVSHTTVHTFWNTAFKVEGDHALVLSHAPSLDDPDGWEKVATRTLAVVRAPHPLAPQAGPATPKE